MTPDSQRPRILLITRNLPPLIGGMERLNWHIAEELAKFAEVIVVGPEGAASSAPSSVIVKEAPLRPLWKFLLTSLLISRSTARKWKPDLVLAGSGLTALATIFAAKASGAKACSYIHGLDVAVGNPIYRALWLPIIRKMHLVIANSGPTAQLCAQIGIPQSRISVIHPGVHIPSSPSSTELLSAINDFRAKHQLDEGPLLLSVGRLTPRKGLYEFVSKALPKIASAIPNVKLVVVGGMPKHALNASIQTVESIIAAAKIAGVADKVFFLGTVSDNDLAIAYRSATAHVFPARNLPDDPEGFGMVAIEAAAHDLPTIAFAVGGIIDAVGDQVSGHLIKPGDYNAFAQCAIDTIRNTSGKLKCKDFAEKFSWNAFGANLRKTLGRLK